MLRQFSFSNVIIVNKMKRILLALALVIPILNTMNAQISNVNTSAALWAKVEKAGKEGKPQTAAGYLRELEQLAVKDGDGLEHYFIATQLYDNLRKYNWKEANRYDSTLSDLRRELFADIDASIERYSGHPREIILYYERLRNHKSEVDNLRKPSGEDYLRIKQECLDLIAKFPKEKDYTQNIRSMLDEMNSVYLGVYDLCSQTAPSTEVTYCVRSKNVQRVTVDIYRLNDGKYFDDNGSKNTLSTLKLNAAKVGSKSIEGWADEYNIREEKEFRLAFDGPGVYVLRFEAGSEVEYRTQQVSDVVGLYRNREGKHEIYAVDFNTGKPYEKVRATLFKNPFSSGKSPIWSPKEVNSARYTLDGFTPADLGRRLDFDRNAYALRLEDVTDKASPLISIYDEGYFRGIKDEKLHSDEVIFTDRKLYKPGETVYYKVISYKSNSTKGEVVPGRSLDMTIRHASSREAVASQKLVTNEMGSAAGSFTIPADGRSGIYYIATQNHYSTSIRVESYKRPTFSVTLDRNEAVLCFGDVIKQSGVLKSYAGYSVAGARVEYEVERRSYNWLARRGCWFNSEIVAQGSVVSDNNGRFEVSFVAARPDLPKDAGDSDVLNAGFVVTVKAVDPQGETHESTIVVPVSDVPVGINLEMTDFRSVDDKMVIDKVKSNCFTVKTTNLNGFPIAMTGKWTILDKSEKTIKSGKFTGNVPVKFDFNSLPSAEYIVKAELSYRGRKIESKQKIALLRTDDRTTPFETTYFYMPIRTDGAIDFLLGTSEDDLYLQMELFDGHTILYRESLHLKNEMRHITIPYNQEYPTGVRLQFIGIRRGERVGGTYTYTRPARVEIPVTIESFRDKTEPGRQEQMIIKTEPGSELLVSIFDKTTDRYSSNSFYFTPLRSVSAGSVPYIRCSVEDGPIFYGTRNLRMMKSTALAPGAVMAVEEEAVMDADGFDESEVASAAEGGGEEDIPVRSDMDETMAFFPQVSVGADSLATIQYTPGDLLSTFRVLVMAHAKDLKTGTAETELVVSRDLMVSPNIPLFAREGDIIRLKSKVVNLTERELTGIGRISIADAASGRVLTPKELGIKANVIPSRSLRLLAGAQKEISWNITVPSNVNRLRVKIWFQSGNISDGEQHEIIIEPDDVTLTESASFIVGGAHGYSYYEKELKKKFNMPDAKIERAEYSTMDAVRESLPKAVEPESNNVIEWINALYINQMRSHVLNLADATAEDKALFASEKAGREAFRVKADAKIKSFQLSDGGFSWFNGMSSSEMLTLLFLEKMAQMRDAGAIEFNTAEKGMIKSALKYIDRVLDSHYDKKNFYPFIHVTSFAVRSLYLDEALSGDASKAFKAFLSGTAEKWQDISILSKGQLALTLLRCKGTGYWDNSFEGRIRMLTESLKDYGVENKTVGLYYPNAVMPFRGLMSSEIYAHSQLLEMYKILGEKRQVRGLSQWLLLQKHNQSWENNVATMDAVYALLSGGVKDLKFGAVYYTYTTSMKRVKESSCELSVHRTFTRVSDGKVLKDGDKIKVGDEIEAVYSIYNTENRSFVAMKAMRPASFYLKDERSYFFSSRYYREVKESCTNFYWELLPEEHCSASETFFVTQEGTFNSGLVQIESLYAPEYRGHTDAMALTSKF